MNVAGAVLAIPVAAAIQVIVTDYLQTRREARQSPDTALSGWRWMRGQLEALEDPPEPGSDRPVTPAAPVKPAPAHQADGPGWTSQLLGRIGRAGADQPEGARPEAEPAAPATRASPGESPD
jgi:hypothetical protein